MEDNSKHMEELLERATDYSKTSIELIKLKAIDKTSDIVSSVIPHSFGFALFILFLIFSNLGLALWLGERLGKMYLGFLILGGVYFIIGLLFYFFFYNQLKRKICINLINKLLN